MTAGDNGSHPGAVLFAGLRDDERVKIADAWDLTPDEAAPFFDRLKRDDRYQILLTLGDRTGAYEREVARIGARADAETTERFERNGRKSAAAKILHTQNLRARSVENRDDTGDEGGAAARALFNFQSRLRTPTEVKAMPRPRYLLDGLIVENTLGLIWGPWGSCKTFLGITWAGYIGSGSWWLGRSVTRTKVLYVACEGVGGLGPRIAAFEQGQRIYHMPGVTFHEGRINLLDRGEVSGFAQGVAEAGFGLILLDTLPRCMPGGDENSAKDVGLLVDACDTVRAASGAAVFALHHSTKEGSSARGISAYLGACDTELEVNAVGTLVTVKCHQQRDGEKSDPITLALQPVNGTESATLVEGAGRRFAPSGTALQVLQALDDDPERGVAASVWGATSGVGVSTFYRHRLVLVKEGLVGTIPGTKHPRYVLTEQGRSELTPTAPTKVPSSQ